MKAAVYSKPAAWHFISTHRLKEKVKENSTLKYIKYVYTEIFVLCAPIWIKKKKKNSKSLFSQKHALLLRSHKVGMKRGLNCTAQLSAGSE